MIDQGEDMYTQEAERIAASEDPRAELLKLARFVVEDRRRMQRRALLAAVAAVAVGAPLALWGLDRWRSDPTGDDSLRATGNPIEPGQPIDEFEAQMAWLAVVRDRPKAEGLTEEETGQVLDAFMSPLPAARRRALRISADYNLQVPDDHLLWFLSNPETADDSMALRLAWLNSARTGSFSRTAALEPFAIDGDLGSRKLALRALGEVRAYRASPALVDSLRGAPDPVLKAARKLLSKSGQ